MAGGDKKNFNLESKKKFGEKQKEKSISIGEEKEFNVKKSRKMVWQFFGGRMEGGWGKWWPRISSWWPRKPNLGQLASTSLWGPRWTVAFVSCPSFGDSGTKF